MNFIDADIDPDELPSDRETKMICRRRRSKPRVHINLKRDENYGTSDSDLDEEQLDERHFQKKLGEEDDQSPNNNNNRNKKKANVDTMMYF